MIERIIGKLIKVDFPHIVVVVNGIGYSVVISANTMSKLPELQKELELLTLVIYKEDSQILYGFASELERSYFNILLKISSVGPKMAMSILSIYDPQAIDQIVADDNMSSLSRVPGIGNKKSERIIFELKNIIKPTTLSGSVDAFSALSALGYKQNEIQKAIRGIDINGKSTEKIITESLQLLSKA